MKIVRNLLITLTVLGVLGVGAFVALNQYVRWAEAPAKPGDKTTVRFTVPPGASLARVADELEQKGVLRSARIFTFLGREAVIKPGVYDVSASEPPVRIRQRLREGDFARNRVTFPEGFTLRQIAARLKKKEMIADEATFLKLVTEQGDSFQASFPLPKNLEGYLFPDTYRIPVGDDDRKIIQRMIGNFDQLVARGKADEIQDSKRPLTEIVNVAAMVEREAEIEADRAKIAGVIYNRLRRGMKLEIDATVQYARGEHKSRLLFRDLEVDSPYNTYKVVGLPAGPICNPGLASIEAALRPETHEFLFYVAEKDRSHAFSRTYQEHLQNIARIRAR